MAAVEQPQEQRGNPHYDIVHILVSEYLQLHTRHNAVKCHDVAKKCCNRSNSTVATWEVYCEAQKNPHIEIEDCNKPFYYIPIRWRGYAPYLLVPEFEKFLKKKNYVKSIHSRNNYYIASRYLFQLHQPEYYAEYPVDEISGILDAHYSFDSVNPVNNGERTRKAIAFELCEFCTHLMNKTKKPWWVL